MNSRGYSGIGTFSRASGAKADPTPMDRERDAPLEFAPSPLSREGENVVISIDNHWKPPPPCLAGRGRRPKAGRGGVCPGHNEIPYIAELKA